MLSKKMDAKTAEPMIRFGGQWIPAHDLWNKMETANVIADAIERFNEKFPYLSSADTRDVVPLVRQRLKDIDLRMPGKDNRPDLSPIALRLLESMAPEDVIEVLLENHDTALDMVQLIQLVGEEAYLGSLSREAHEFSLNLISPDQTAELWNETSRPAPGGGLWTGKIVSQLLG